MNSFSFLSNTIRPDGMVSATALTTAYRMATMTEVNPNGVRKDVRDWLKTESANRSMACLAGVTGIPVTELVISEHGVGTWIHPKLAPILAMWISPEFQFAVVDLIEREMNKAEAIPPAPEAPKLRPDLLAVEVSESIVKISNNLHNNPRLAQILIDSAMNTIIDTNALPAHEFPEDQWFGLVQIAEKMGVKANASTRVKLGQYVGKHFDLERVRENRICNGQPTDIWCYRDDEATRSAIAQWFDRTQRNLGRID